MRLVALGASNLRRELSVLVATTREAAGEPLEVLAACGHGRSYGSWSAILGGVRALPGITGCGLWPALAMRPPERTVAFVTDVGNDLVYGYDAGRIASWVGSCLQRLADAGATTVLTLPPRVSIEALPDWQLEGARRFFFPGRDLSRAVLEERMGELEKRLGELARIHDATIVEPSPDWYGLDPIHLHRRGCVELRRELFAHWSLDPAVDARLAPLSRLRLALARAERIRWLGIECGRKQPALRFADGGAVALY